MASLRGYISVISSPKQLISWIFLWTVFSHWIHQTDGRDDGCRMPKRWKGRWWQSGLGDVIVRDAAINQKGSCIEHHRDYYLFHNKMRDCYQCLLIIERHENLLQYKESFCSGSISLERTCQQIQVESPLYTLVREPNNHIPCPFQDAFYFNYNAHGSGYCPTALSYAKPCVGQYQYQMHFQHCQDYALLNGRDLELECLATWKDGSDTYLYGRYSGPGVVDKDSAYRCFKYEQYGSELLLSMSIDPTCRGLRSATDGPVVFTFTKDLNGWPPPSCQFPDWLEGTTWRDIEGRHMFELEQRSKVLSGYYRKRINARAHMNYQFRCMEILGRDDNRPEVILLTFSTHRCVSKHQCLKITKLQDGVLELHQGSLVDYDGNGRCFHPNEYGISHTLISEDSQPVQCPTPNYFTIVQQRHDDVITSCDRYLDVGCRHNNSMQITSLCPQIVYGFRIECMAWWNGRGRTYIIGRDGDMESRLYNCFSFREQGSTFEFGTDRECNQGIPNMFDANLRFRVHPFGHCDQTLPPPSSRDSFTASVEPGSQEKDYIFTAILPGIKSSTTPAGQELEIQVGDNTMDSSNKDKGQADNPWPPVHETYSTSKPRDKSRGKDQSQNPRERDKQDGINYVTPHIPDGEQSAKVDVDSIVSNSDIDRNSAEDVFERTEARNPEVYDDLDSSEELENPLVSFSTSSASSSSKMAAIFLFSGLMFLLVR